MDATISICIGNYSAYNSGYLIDRWVDLPQEPAVLEATIEEMRRNAELLTGSPSEEFYVSDYDGIPFGFEYGRLFSEYTSIGSLNVLAKVMEEHPNETETMQAVLDTGCDVPDSLLGLCNWILQADELPYYSYSIDLNLFKNDSNELKMGYSCAIDSGLFEKLEELDVLSYFDFEHYGREMSHDAHLGEAGYVDAALPMPREDRFSWDEIKDDIGWGGGKRENLSPTLDGAKAAQKNRPKVEQTGIGPKQ